MDNVATMQVEDAVETLEEFLDGKFDDELSEIRRNTERLAEDVEELEDEKRRQGIVIEELEQLYEAACELLQKSGVIPDTPENQHKLGLSGLRWELLKYEAK